jgi:hypothetical protein
MSDQLRRPRVATNTRNDAQSIYNMATAINELSDQVMQPLSFTDAAAPSNTIYFSTTVNKLVYKDAGGLTHALY